MRTMPMKWGKSNGSHPDRPVCVVCRKPINHDTAWFVHVIDGGDRVLHPDDELAYNSDAGEMGLHYVGPECRKMFGEFAIKAEAR